jgi:hypothetical protein
VKKETKSEVSQDLVLAVALPQGVFGAPARTHVRPAETSAARTRGNHNPLDMRNAWSARLPNQEPEELVRAASCPFPELAPEAAQVSIARALRFSYFGFRNRTPGPPPFSSMNSTPAASKARRTAESLAVVIAVAFSVSSARRIVATPTEDSRARS